MPPMLHNRHFIPGVATAEAFLFAAIADAQVTAYGAAVVALVATTAGTVHDILSKRTARREAEIKLREAEVRLREIQAKAEHELKVRKARDSRHEQWQKWCLKQRMDAIAAGRPDPFPNGLPPLEADEDHECELKGGDE